MPRDSRAVRRSLLNDEPSVAVAPTNRNNPGRVVDIGSGRQTIAFVGDYLPRMCGIATFTSDLLEAVAAADPPSRCFAVPVTDIEGAYRYPDAVRHEIQEQDPLSYLQAADFLNSSGVDVVSLQHEFGIFGTNRRKNAARSAWTPIARKF